MKDKIMLAHGSGGKLMHELVRKLFKEKFSNEILNELSDAAVIESIPEKDAHLCFTTDSYTIDPLFFPGGDIGKLAIFGTVNDLAVMGAKPLYISTGFIVEEGLDYELLERVTESMAQAARDEGVQVVTGDLKVVERGSADKLFINTAGIGTRRTDINLSREAIVPGDKIIVNGPLGDHGMAVLAARGDFDFQTQITSDCASLTSLIKRIINLSSESAGASGVKFMRDPTRGGLATTLNELVEGVNFGILLNEGDIPVREDVKAACEILGLDPLYIANEGKVVVVVSEEDADVILEVMRQDPFGKGSRIVGEAVGEPKGKVLMETKVGGSRILDMLTGEQLPRIC